jgi:hypothetical protein
MFIIRHFSIDDFIRSDKKIAIICGVIVNSSNGEENTHCGIIYKKDFIEPRIFHLGFHHMLYDTSLVNRVFNRSLCVEFRQFRKDPGSMRVKSLTDFIESVYTNNKGTLSYALYYDHLTKFDNSGAFNKAGKTIGLTCATFILAFLSSKSIMILKSEQWKPRPYDELFKIWVLRLFALFPRAVLHANQVSKETLNGLIRPEEVTMASANKKLPAKFRYCKKGGVKIINELNFTYSSMYKNL